MAWRNPGLSTRSTSASITICSKREICQLAFKVDSGDVYSRAVAALDLPVRAVFGEGKT